MAGRPKNGGGKKPLGPRPREGENVGWKKTVLSVGKKCWLEKKLSVGKKMSVGKKKLCQLAIFCSLRGEMSVGKNCRLKKKLSVGIFFCRLGEKIRLEKKSRLAK